MSKNMNSTVSFTFKRTNKTATSLDDFGENFDLLSVLDGWLDDSLAPFLKAVSPDKYFLNLKKIKAENKLLHTFADYQDFAQNLFSGAPVPVLVVKQLNALRSIEQFVPSSTFRAGQNSVLRLPEDVELEMIWCPAGTFMMGSPDDECGRSHDEFYHEVTLDHGFWLGRYPVTQKQFRTMTGRENACCSVDQAPVTMITRDEAADFCHRLNSCCQNILPDGYRFALPSEAQWEYACRAGTTTAFSNGKNFSEEVSTEDCLGDIAWCPAPDDLGDHCGWLIYEPRPVGQFAPNPWGFYDMHGNVCEWCSDIYQEKDGLRERCAAKGGSCIEIACGMPEECRSAAVGHYVRHYYESDTGFRLALKKIEE